MVSWLTAGYGYAKLEELKIKMVLMCNISHKTAGRWIDTLISEEMINIKKGVVYVLGRAKLKSPLEKSRRYVRYELDDMKTYKKFLYHSIRQLCLLIQVRFSYSYRFLSASDPHSLVENGRIETRLAALKSADQAGCSLSQAVKKIGIDKATISRALKGHTIKQANYFTISGKQARFKFKGLIEALSGKYKNTPNDISRVKSRALTYQWFFEYSKKQDVYLIGYKLGSKIDVKASFCRHSR